MSEKTSKTSNPAEILDRALVLSPETGWTEALIDQLKTEFGLVVMNEHYPAGVIDLLYAFADRADQAMLEALAAMDLDTLKIRDRIRIGVKARLEFLIPVKVAFAASMKYMTHPLRAADLKRISWRTADRLWWAAGDTSTDYNHYSKRILLSGVFATTTLYWLNDSSDDYHKSWAFLERRINNVLTIGKFLGRFKKSG